MSDLERHNQRVIDGLNQRGGRMLSMVDLLAAGTVALEMAAEMVEVVAGGGSFLTAAGPGGVGKTTLMGAMLAFLPTGTRIVTIEGPRTLARLAGRPPADRECLVVHEIGAGAWQGYLWGSAVGRYFELGTAARRCLASNLHAETYEQAAAQLTGAPLGVAPEALGRIDLLAFMAAPGGKRRVTAVWRRGGGGHEMVWRWSPADDGFERVRPASPAGGARRCRDFLARAWHEGCTPMEDLRRRALTELF